MEGKFIFLNLCLLFILFSLLIQKYKKVYETYSDYFNEDLFRTINESNESNESTTNSVNSPIEINDTNNGFKLTQLIDGGSYSDDPNASACFDRYNSAQELGVVSANKLYSTEKKEISKGKFIRILDNLSETHHISERNENLLDVLQCDDESPDCVKKMEYLYVNNDFNSTSNSTYDLCKDWLLDRINEKMVEYDQTTDYDHIPFSIQRDTILKFKLVQDETTNIDYFKFLITLNRTGKNKVFSVRVEMLYDKNSDDKSIISIKLDGLTTNEHSSSGFMEFHRNAYYNCDNNGISCSLSDRPECKPPSNNEISQVREAEAEATRRDLDSKCFYKEAENEAQCISIDASGCSGVWDTKCNADTDCPFFGAKGNLNYPNERGGCKKDGHCELPLNMVNIGYTKYSDRDEDRPLCHNCPKIKNCIGKECSQCCHLQGDNPDYAYEFDKPFREREKGVLEAAGLSYFDIHF